MAAVTLALTLATQTFIIHGHPQQVHVYGPAHGRPAIVLSGDGGWRHLAPHLAAALGRHGWSVTGFDAKAYLSSGTSAGKTLTVDDVQRDFGMLIELASEAAERPLLIGVSEGAGLAVAAAADPRVRGHISGVVTFGLTDENELGWHWRDSIIYLTKGVPNEPVFHAGDFVPLVSPAPLVLVWSTHDEFVSGADQRRLAALARSPRRVLTVAASDHRFSDNLSSLDTSLLEALEWISRFRGR